MELRAYWRIIRRRWWLPVGLALLVLVFTLAMQRPWQAKPTTFSASMRFNVGIQPERIPGVYTYDRYYTMLTSEYLVDDLGEIVRSQVFAQEVSKRLAEQGHHRARRRHRRQHPAGEAAPHPDRERGLAEARGRSGPSPRRSSPRSPRAAPTFSASSARTRRTSG